MIDTVLLYVALAVFALGSVYRMSAWVRHNVRTDTPAASPWARLASALQGVASTLFSAKFFTLLRVFVVDAVLQIRILRRSPYRWIMHMCIYGGFMLLLLLHALDAHITARLFSGYQSSANPYVFIRDFAGALVVLGVLMAVYRRFVGGPRRPPTRDADTALIVVLAVILLSGIMLKGTKITSYTRYQEMVDEYGVILDEEETKLLEAYWAEEFLVASPNMEGPFDDRALEKGEALHEMACAECHPKPYWAFTSYAFAVASQRVAPTLDQQRFPDFMWWVHYLACMIGLAYIPFSKMFHFFTTPLSLMTNAVMDKETADPLNLATKQMMELDACMHCGACTLACSVGIAVEEVPNEYILPSEKIPAIKELAAGKPLTPQKERLIQQGLHLCTTCNRCAEACPAGIQLTDLWLAVKETLLRKGIPEPLLLSPLSVHRSVSVKERLRAEDYEKPLESVREALGTGSLAELRRDPAPLAVPGPEKLFDAAERWMKPEVYATCYRCTTCTSACPVVRDDPEGAEKLGLLPHQIMYAVKLRQWDLIFDSKMLWDCLGCYQCQEQCPQSVQVADVLYLLKNRAIARAMENGPSGQEEGVI